MTPEHIQNLVDALDMELYMIQLNSKRGDTQLVEFHANKMISLAGELRRECFLSTHRSGEKG